MKKRVAIFCAIVCWILLFFYLIPTDVVASWTVSLALLGSVGMLGLVVYFFFSFDRIGSVDIFWLKLLMIVVSFFGFAVLFIYSAFYKEKIEFERHGVLCKGLIVFQEQQQFEHDEHYPIQIRYQINEKQSNSVSMQLRWKDFNETNFNWYVPVIYSSRFPYWAKVISHKNEYVRYAHYFDTLNKEVLNDIPFIDTTDISLLHNLKVYISMGRSAPELKEQLLKNHYNDTQIDSIFKQMPLEIIPEDSTDYNSILSVLATLVGVVGLVMKLFGRK
ncbi:MAG: hypothetical protein KA198_08910 [Chitinophagaceae bacterium]|nr:hypothetical protein [Chitinophagaceae bacterium]